MHVGIVSTFLPLSLVMVQSSSCISFKQLENYFRRHQTSIRSKTTSWCHLHLADASLINKRQQLSNGRLALRAESTTLYLSRPPNLDGHQKGCLKCDLYEDLVLFYSSTSFTHQNMKTQCYFTHPVIANLFSMFILLINLFYQLLIELLLQIYFKTLGI